MQFSASFGQIIGWHTLLEILDPPLEGNDFSPVCSSFYPWGASHVTISHDALDLTVQGPLALAQVPFTGTSTGQHLRPVHTCSLEEPALAFFVTCAQGILHFTSAPQ